jgi:hypothetical protein
MILIYLLSSISLLLDCDQVRFSDWGGRFVDNQNAITQHVQCARYGCHRCAMASLVKGKASVFNLSLT